MNPKRPASVPFVALVRTTLLGFASLVTVEARATSTSAVWHVLAGPVDPPPMFGHVAIHDLVRHRMVFVNRAR